MSIMNRTLLPRAPFLNGRDVATTGEALLSYFLPTFKL